MNSEMVKLFSLFLELDKQEGTDPQLSVGSLQKRLKCIQSTGNAPLALEISIMRFPDVIQIFQATVKTFSVLTEGHLSEMKSKIVFSDIQ